MNPKYAQAEAQRQQRLISLYSWGKLNLSAEEIAEGGASSKLADKALEMFGVSTYTANNYAKVVVWRLKKEMVSANDN